MVPLKTLTVIKAFGEEEPVPGDVLAKVVVVEDDLAPEVGLADEPEGDICGRTT